MITRSEDRGSARTPCTKWERGGRGDLFVCCYRFQRRNTGIIHPIAGKKSFSGENVHRTVHELLRDLAFFSRRFGTALCVM